MPSESLPIEFWKWIAEHDPERLPFRSAMDDPAVAEVYEYALRRVQDE